MDNLGIHLQLLKHLSHWCRTLDGSVPLEYLDQCTPHSATLTPASLEDGHLKPDHQTLGDLSLRTLEEQISLKMKGKQYVQYYTNIREDC